MTFKSELEPEPVTNPGCGKNFPGSNLLRFVVFHSIRQKLSHKIGLAWGIPDENKATIFSRQSILRVALEEMIKTPSCPF